MEARSVSRGMATGLLILAVIISFSLLLWLLGYEMNLFIGKLPQIKSRVITGTEELGNWLTETFGFDEHRKQKLSADVSSNLLSGLQHFANSALSATIATLLQLVMIPIYCALFLYHRETFVKFVLSLTPEQQRENIYEILRESTFTYYKFVKGTFFVYCIVGLLNSTGLLLLGIEYAFVFGMITAFMTAIPYVGIIISAALPISIALVTKDSAWYAIGVIAVFTIVQYLEANIIYPRIVGQQLNLSTWAVLTAAIIGTLFWGIAGMILFIPFTAILKIISDKTEALRPVNILLNRNEGYKTKKEIKA